MQDQSARARKNLKYLTLLAREYPNIAAASSEIINLQAILKLPKGTEHFMSDLHGEAEAFTHIVNNASGVIKEKVDRVLGPGVPDQERAEFATLIYYPAQKLDELKERQTDLNAWYRQTLYRLIDVCRVVSSKHTRSFVRKRLPKNYAYILDELLHAHFEDHDKEFYYGQILSSIIDVGRADDFIEAMCVLIKNLAVFKLHIVGDIFDRGPRPDQIMEQLLNHHSVDIQWGNHDVVWMGAAAGSPICIATVLRTSLAYNNLEALEDGYGINLRPLALFAESEYRDCDMHHFYPRTDEARGPYHRSELIRTARMHKAIAIIMFKLECQVIDRNPDFELEGRDFLRRIDYREGTVEVEGKRYPLRDDDFPTVNPADPARLTRQEQEVMEALQRSFMESERLQRHVRFLFSKGGVYHIENGNLLFHGAVPLTDSGSFAVETFEQHGYAGRALMDYCDERARRGYFAPEGSAERQSGEDFLWYLWCGKLSPLYGRDKMTTFERLFVEDPDTHTETKNPYYRHVNDSKMARAILAEFGLDQTHSHIVNGHVPVRAAKGETPVKGEGRLIVIDGGFCRAYHEKTGIAGYTLVYNSRGMSLRQHQPFESAEKAIRENLDIVSTVDVFETCEKRTLVGDTDNGRRLAADIEDLKLLVQAYQMGLVKEKT
ncbi:MULTISPECIES: fructose-1,6-bisphosphatase [Eubacteriales]|uniref:fructose-1,6-bisphosphatase n=1 Tax=Eubacteriales TaxID=186802 RepID=UPI000B39A95D|nr:MULTISPECIES: fructose-1,6-bisphosphatase [Eubacteriales]MDY4166708.1 fructose-1,6-bisphosphatase [Fournierella sp.]OUP24326.1 fructose-bisphosphatase class III [Gemmiger sp. An194]